MDLLVKINNVDKTSLIEWESFDIEDNVNEQPNLCNFTIRVFDTQSYKPEISDTVEVYDDTDKIFAGKIIRVVNTAVGGVIYYELETKDYTLDLDRILVNESFKSQTVAYIIDFIRDNYLDGITTNNVSCDILVDTIHFPNLSASKSIDELAQLVGFSWYIDYDKDIHFFALNDEPAPFNLADGSENYIVDSLSIENDLSQLRNVVKVEGGKVISDLERTKEHEGDGVTDSFATDNEFAERPVIEVNSVVKSVGIEFLQEDTGFDCMWNAQQKYVRFITPPTAGHAITITAKFKIPILVQVEEAVSISEYGRFEFNKVDKTIQSTDEAKQYAEAQLSAYAGTIREGGFNTYDTGLVSGQTISINLTDREIDASFIIQRVSLTMRSATEGEWSVSLATLKTLGIIRFLQDLLIKDKKNLDVNEDVVIKKYYLDSQDVAVQEFIEVKLKMEDWQDVDVTEDIAKDPFGANTSPDFVLTPYTPTGQTDPKREFVLDRSYLS